MKRPVSVLFGAQRLARPRGGERLVINRYTPTIVRVQEGAIRQLPFWRQQHFSALNRDDGELFLVCAREQRCLFLRSEDRGIDEMQHVWRG